MHVVSYYTFLEWMSHKLKSQWFFRCQFLYNMFFFGDVSIHSIVFVLCDVLLIIIKNYCFPYIFLQPTTSKFYI